VSPPTAVVAVLRALRRFLIIRRHRVASVPTADVTHRARFELKRSTGAALNRSIDASTSFTIRLVEILRRAAVLAEPLEILPQMMHGLREIDVNAPVIDQNVVHLEVRRLRLGFSLKVDEGVAETRASLEVAYDVASGHLAESTEDDL
tara:strand:+ start:385 stop:828 length:444 start_codon:yes stop_codon:yes gene_type:complete